MVKLIDLASALRSKNAGPLLLTFDIMFSDNNTYEKVKKSGAINKKTISQLYHVNEEDVSIIEYDVVHSLKVTIPRIYPSGDINDTDIYGCQQHSPLSSIIIPDFEE